MDSHELLHLLVSTLHNHLSQCTRSSQLTISLEFTNVFPGDFSTSLRLDGFMGPLSPYPLTFGVPLRWATAKAAERLFGNTTAESAKLICRSRCKAIEHLRTVMSDPQVSTDELLASAVYTIVKNDGNEKMHLRGLDTVIVARRGLDVVLQETKIGRPEHLVHMYTSAPFSINGYDQLLLLKTIFLTTIRYIRTSIASVVPAVDCVSGLPESHALEQHHVFSKNTVIGRHIRSNFDTSSAYSMKARRFCTLLMISLIWLSLDTQANRGKFLVELDEATNAAASIDSATAKLGVRAGALGFIVGHVHGQTPRLFDTLEVLLEVSRMTTVAVACLKIFGVLSDELRLAFFLLLQRGIVHLSGDTACPTPTLG